ncbi:MAG: hypothetical protein HY961_11470 [Ignavibacteriae bacterium]|nr:hypothetical protein [Ignavibacteriota bacterium]
MNKRTRWLLLIGGVVAVLTISALLVLQSSMLNEIVKMKAVQAFNEAFPQYTLSIEQMRLHLWQNEIVAESVLVTAKDSSFVGTAAAITVGGIHWTEILGDSSYDAFRSAVAEVEVTALEFPRSSYQLTFSSFTLTVPDSAAAVEGLKILSVRNNFQSNTSDSGFALELASIAIGGVSWVRLLANREIQAFKNSRAEINDAVVLFQSSQYKLQAASVHLSVPDSQILLNEIRYHPTKNDNDFFRASRFRSWPASSAWRTPTTPCAPPVRTGKPSRPTRPEPRS